MIPTYDTEHARGSGRKRMPKSVMTALQAKCERLKELFPAYEAREGQDIMFKEVCER